MSKYNIMATKADWNRIYERAEKYGFEVAPFKKSQNFDSAVYALLVEIKNKTGKTLSEITKEENLYCYDNTIKIVAN